MADGAQTEVLPVPYFHFVFALPAVIGADG